MNEKTASQSRYETAHAQRAHALLATRLEYQAEAIANHYTAHALVALHLKRAVAERQRHGPSDGRDRFIEILLNQIKSAHLHDFGIPLEWKTLFQSTGPEW